MTKPPKKPNLPAKPIRRRCYGVTSNLRRCGRTGSWRLYCSDHVLQPWIFAASAVFALAFTVLPGLDFWLSKTKQSEPSPQEIRAQSESSPQEIRTQLQKLDAAEKFTDMQSILLKIEGRPELAGELNYYSLKLATISPGIDGATPPDFYFARIDPGSMLYGQAIRHISFYYLRSAGSWGGAKYKFEELSQKIERSGRILPQKFFVEMMAMGPNAKYDDIFKLYQRVMESYGGYFTPDGVFGIIVDVEGLFPFKSTVELVQVPSLLLLLHQEMSIAAARECREVERQQAIKKAKEVAAGQMLWDDADRINFFADAFFAAADVLEEQRQRLSAVTRAVGDC